MTRFWDKRAGMRAHCKDDVTRIRRHTTRQPFTLAQRRHLVGVCSSADPSHTVRARWPRRPRTWCCTTCPCAPRAVRRDRSVRCRSARSRDSAPTEPLRMMLRHGGIAFTNHVFTWPEWSAAKQGAPGCQPRAAAAVLTLAQRTPSPSTGCPFWRWTAGKSQSRGRWPASSRAGRVRRRAQPRRSELPGV